MKQLALLLVAVLALVACKKQNTSNEEETMQYVGGESDSTRYGVVVRIIGDSLHWMNENGDSLITCIGGSVVYGDLEEGSRIALLYEPSNKNRAKTVIDMTELMGRWVEPDAVDEGSVHGFELEEGGAANSINSRANHYISWRIFNGKLLLKNTIDGMGNSDVPEDTFNITFLTKDSLRVYNSMSKYFFRRSSGEEVEEGNESAFETYESPDNEAFDPEGDAPSNENKEIPENDKIF